ncbi:MAG: hypothetical protein V4438_01650 [Patescibacteria group bacterium]
MSNHSLKEINPPQNLAGRICLAIECKARSRARVRFGLLAALSITSITSSVIFFVNLWQSITKTAFYDYLSIVISDTGTISAFWKQLLASLAESVPAFALIIFLAASGVSIMLGVKTFKSAAVLKAINI